MISLFHSRTRNFIVHSCTNRDKFYLVWYIMIFIFSWIFIFARISFRGNMKLIARALYNTGDRMKLEKCETREIRNVKYGIWFVFTIDEASKTILIFREYGTLLLIQSRTSNVLFSKNFRLSFSYFYSHYRDTLCMIFHLSI